jgi:hypothetical protein
VDEVGKVYLATKNKKKLILKIHVNVKLNNNQSINVVDIYVLYAKEMISTCETCCTFKLAKYLILS